MLKVITGWVTDQIYPPRCLGCEAYIREGIWCELCHHLALGLGDDCCDVCSTPLQRAHETRCFRCVASRPLYSRAASFYRYEGLIREVVRAVKVSRQDTVGSRFATGTRGLAQHFIDSWEPDGIAVPPPRPEALVERGFYWPFTICKRWGLGAPLMLEPSRLSSKQAVLGRHERSLNIAGTMRCPQDVEGRWLIVDDVMTTGATANECARALLDAGAVEVYALTLARVA